MAASSTFPLALPSRKATGRSSHGWSYYGTYRECPRKFAFQYGAAFGYTDSVPEGSEVSAGGRTNLGSFVHALMELFYRRRLLTDEALALSRPPPALPPDPTRLSDADVVALRESTGTAPFWCDDDIAEALRRFRLYAAEPRDWKPIAVETEYAVALHGKIGGPILVEALPLGEVLPKGGVIYTARFDLVASTSEGAILTIDHKTAARISDDTLDGYGMSGQIHGHDVIGRAHFGASFAGARLNFFPTTKAGKFGPPVRPPAAPAMIAEFPRLIVSTAAEIDLWRRNAKSARDWPTRSGFFCPRCPFARACRFGGPAAASVADDVE